MSSHLRVEVNKLSTESSPTEADHEGVTDQYKINVNNPNVNYSHEFIESKYIYEKNHVEMEGQRVVITPQKHEYIFRTQRKVPRTGKKLENKLCL
jgi:hypothetical protein